MGIAENTQNVLEVDVECFEGYEDFMVYAEKTCSCSTLYTYVGARVYPMLINVSMVFT